MVQFLPQLWFMGPGIKWVEIRVAPLTSSYPLAKYLPHSHDLMFCLMFWPRSLRSKERMLPPGDTVYWNKNETVIQSIWSLHTSELTAKEGDAFLPGVNSFDTQGETGLLFYKGNSRKGISVMKGDPLGFLLILLFSMIKVNAIYNLVQICLMMPKLCRNEILWHSTR